MNALGSMAAAEGLDGGGRRGMPGEGEGELPAGALGGVGTVAQRPIGEPGDDTGFVGRQPRAAADLVAPTEDRQFAAGASRRVIGIVGRARRSSRLAATISGIPGTTPWITINRHIGRSVRGCRLPASVLPEAGRRGKAETLAKCVR